MEGESKYYTQEQAEREGNEMFKELDNKYPEQKGNFDNEQYAEVDKQLKKQQVELIKDLTSENSPGYLFGGFASELLSTGNIEAPHTDVDVAIRRQDEELLRNELSSQGFELKGKVETDPNKPTKLYIKNAGLLKGDFALVDIEKGEPYITTELKDGRVVRLYFSPDMFSGPTVNFENENIKVVSPRSLIQTLLFYSQVDKAQVRAKDLNRAQRLIDKYYPNETVNSEMFKVRIEDVIAS